MPQTFILALFAAFFVWLLLLTILFWKLYIHYNKLMQAGGVKGLRPLLEELLKASDANKKDIEMLRTTCARIDSEGQFHIQKVGLLRFNPFKDTGGDQSFILSLVDKNDTGVIISGLYSRSGLRWYAKKIIHGKGVDYELSDEEKKALEEAGSTKKE
ncbi:MAG: DUF4446 family protein [Patescibacteria group bacterium]